MTKKSIIIWAILILVVIIGSFWYFNNQEQVKNKEQIETVEQQEFTTQNQQEEKQDEEKQVVEKIKQKQSSESIEGQGSIESNAESIKNIKPKFGIDDSGLKYNKDGSVDTSDWKTFEHLGDQYLLPPGWSITETNGPNGSMEMINLANYNDLSENLNFAEILDIDSVVMIGLVTAPVDLNDNVNIDAAEKSLEAILVELVKSEVEHPLFAKCDNGLTNIGTRCENVKPKCSYNKQEGLKYAIVQCIYDETETDENMYILNKTIFKIKDNGIIELSVYIKTKHKNLIPKYSKIYNVVVDQVFKNILE